MLQRISAASLRGKTFAFTLLGGLILVGLTGCGRKSDRLKTAPASGSVTFNGKPVPQGSLLFIPTVPGPPGQANLKPDGTFVAGTYEIDDGLVPGEYAVAITGQMEVEPEPTATPLAENAGKTKAPEQLPEKYGSYKTSGLTATVELGEKHDLNFDLTK